MSGTILHFYKSLKISDLKGDNWIIIPASPFNLL